MKYSALAVAAVPFICVPAEVSAQSRKIEHLGSALQALLPLAGAFCAYRQSEVPDYSAQFVGQPSRDYLTPTDGGAGNGPENRGDEPLSFVAGGEAAVSGAGYLNENCISGGAGQVVVGGLAAFANASDLVFGDQEIGLLSMGPLVGFRNENWKLRVSSRSLKVKFTFDF